ncbi:MAG: HAMP domain-containing histidine kinase [Clostridiales bacterium]|nr:HAMP domain-containing histidine kinase [Clostridiales bacterium]
MKNVSIRLKVTLWYTVALIFVVALTYFMILFVGNQVLQKTVRDNLIETVEDNVDEVEFFASLDGIDLSSDVDHFAAYGDGYLEVDDDFLDAVNEVYTALYYADGTLLYGENPVAREVAELDFIDSQVQTITIDGTLYYVFDRQLVQEGLEGLWLRGVVAETQGTAQMEDISRLSLILLPSLVVLAAVGGYLVARRALRPIQQISEAASQISQGDDLKRRIDLGKGNDELHQLADSFNEMFARLDAAFEAEQQFTSDASHELRTPMSVIMAQCEYSLEEPRTAEEYQQALEVVQRQGRKMSRLINDMLDFARLELHTERYQKETVDLTELVSSTCEDLALIQEKGITLTWEAAPAVTVNGNRELLSRLLVNLVSNAYRYGTESGHIRVALRDGADALTLSVADDGIGIAAEEQEKIFDRFYQADASRSGAGSGLGLSMVAQIAQFHGGTVTVESAPGVGSTFTLTLGNLPKNSEKI